MTWIQPGKHLMICIYMLYHWWGDLSESIPRAKKRTNICKLKRLWNIPQYFHLIPKHLQMSYPNMSSYMHHIQPIISVVSHRTSPRLWKSFGTKNQSQLQPTCLNWLLRRTLLSCPVMKNLCSTQVQRRVLDRRLENKQVGTDVELVRTRLIINVGSTNRTLPNESFKAYERKKAALGPLRRCLLWCC